MTTAVGRRPGRRLRSGGTRRLGALAVTVTVAVVGVASCGGHSHHAAAPAPARPAGPGSTTSSTTTVKVVVHHAPGPIVAPLTGLPASPALVRRAAVVVKIDNVTAALPQSGPDQADVVYEEMVEGGLTRLAAVFQSHYPAVAGPVRSGRLTDEAVADDLGRPVLAYAGANPVFQPQLAAQPVTDVDDQTNRGLFSVDPGRQAPHSTYSDVAGLAATDTAHSPPPALWAFAPPGTSLRGAGVRPAGGISIGFPATAVGWTWSPTDRGWLRTQNGEVDVDSKGAQLSASNVIVEFVRYVASSYVSGEGAGADGGAIPEGELVGRGTAWFLSGGVVVEGTWSRASLEATTVYRDAAGSPIRLQPGRTWVELPPVGTVSTLTP